MRDWEEDWDLKKNIPCLVLRGLYLIWYSIVSSYLYSSFLFCFIQFFFSCCLLFFVYQFEFYYISSSAKSHAVLHLQLLQNVYIFLYIWFLALHYTNFNDRQCFDKEIGQPDMRTASIAIIVINLYEKVEFQAYFNSIFKISSWYLVPDISVICTGVKKIQFIKKPWELRPSGSDIWKHGRH